MVLRYTRMIQTIVWRQGKNGKTLLLRKGLPDGLVGCDAVLQHRQGGWCGRLFGWFGSIFHRRHHPRHGVRLPCVGRANIFHRSSSILKTSFQSGIVCLVLVRIREQREQGCVPVLTRAPPIHSHTTFTAVPRPSRQPPTR